MQPIIRVLSAVCTLALVAGLTSCSAAPPTPSASAPESAESARSIMDTYTGTVEGVPVDPQRIVALWRVGSELGDLGIVPVGQLEGEMTESELGPEVFASVAEVPVIGTYSDVDIERLAALEPDLIVGMDHGGLSLDYDEISTVAPTVILPIAEPTDVWDNYPRLADVVGVATTYAERQAALDADLAALSRDVSTAAADAKVTALGSSEGTLWVSTSKSLTHRRITAAGFDYNDAYEGDPERYVEELSEENIADLADQDIIFYTVEIDGTPTSDTQRLLDMPSFQELPAVRAGHAYPLTSGVIYTFAAADRQVADLRAALTDFGDSR